MMQQQDQSKQTLSRAVWQKPAVEILGLDKAQIGPNANPDLNDNRS